MKARELIRATAKKSEHYSYKRIDKTDSLYNLIIGMRSNGKTYGSLEKVLKSKSKNGRASAYIRRYAESITPKNLKDLFSPLSHSGNNLISELTNGQWNCTSYKANKFTFAFYDTEKGKITENSDDVIMYTAALNTWETSKGADKGAINYIIFDEFMTRELYLANEFVIFMNVVSSFIRDRDCTKIYMLANTVSKQCPYFSEFGIKKDVMTMKKGEIQIIKYDTAGLQLAVEYCDSVTASRKTSKYFAFDNPRLQMITSGEWEIPHYPRAPISIQHADIKKRIYIKYDERVIAADMVRDPETHGTFINVHEHSDEIRNYEKQIVYIKEPDSNPRHLHDLRDKTNEYSKLFVELIILNKIFYSNNDIGDLFNNFVKEFSHKTIA